MANGKQYEFKDVRAIRGTESRSIAKWQKAGWELVGQSQGPLGTKLTFRRPKKNKVLLLAAAAGVVVVALTIGLVSSAFGGDDASHESTTAASASETPEPTTSQTPSPSPTEAPSESPSASPSSSPSESPKPSPTVPETLTVKNNRDFAALLAGSDGEYQKIAAFANKYAGHKIEFDGNIAAMGPHGSYSTRYDMLILAGDFSPTSASGPNFQFRDVNTVYDLNFQGHVPGRIGVGDNLHVVARVDHFERRTGLFLLEPVSTRVR